MICLNEERITVYPRLFIGLYVVIYIYLVLPGLFGSNILDRYGSPIGSDFSGFYSGALLARAECPAAVYDIAKMRAEHEKTIGAKTENISGWWWAYPPPFLLLMLPFSYLPYFLSLIIWLISTFLISLGAIRRIAPLPQTIWLMIAFPGTFQNFIHAQNGFLSAALFGWGLLMLDRCPFWGGSILGLLTFKPQMAVLVPIALVAGHRWKAMAGVFISSSVIIFASIIILGNGAWVAFYHSLPAARRLYESGALPIYKIGTVYNAVLLAWGNFTAARFFQSFVMVIAAVIVFVVWGRNLSLSVRASVLVLSTLLFTPYAYPYDFILLSLPLAWLGWEGYTKGWLRSERSLLIVGWLLPILIPILGKIHLQLAPLVLISLIWLSLRRGTSVQIDKKQSNKLWIKNYL